MIVLFLRAIDLATAIKLADKKFYLRQYFLLYLDKVKTSFTNLFGNEAFQQIRLNSFVVLLVKT